MRCLLVFIMVCMLYSCNDPSKKIKETLKEWQNKEIIFPTSLQAKLFGKDTVCNQLLAKKYKILLHVDSTGCSQCKLQLYGWLKFMKKYQDYTDSLSFIYVAHVLNPHKMTILCKQNKFNYPIFYDVKGIMDKLNNFPKDDSYRCFLLDENNKVLLIGNPLNNPNIEKLYNNIIFNNKNQNN